MELKDFIGKIVIRTTDGKRLVLDEITSPEIKAWTLNADATGHYTRYCWRTIHGDPFSKGELIFEDPSLTDSFKAFYQAYCRTEDAFWEEYGYWMGRE